MKIGDRNYFICLICKRVYSCNLFCSPSKKPIDSCVCEDCLRKSALELGMSKEAVQDLIQNVKKPCEVKRASKKMSALIKLKFKLEGKKVENR